MRSARAARSVLYRHGENSRTWLSQIKRSGRLPARSRDADAVGAALVGQEAEEATHRRIVRPADQRGALTLLLHETGQDEPMQMVRERRSRDLQLLLQPPNGKAGIAGAHQCAIDLEPRRIAERLELLCCFFDFHRTKMTPERAGCQAVFRENSKFLSGVRSSAREQPFGSGVEGRT